ncbi:anti-sigma-factor antagonist [Chloroherpeton thalassium ATCC 35110]|uniref:Anti-sigma factor antagonist n=1 Tax=Chloroherpeton thalassium (strain ATCC 35110 / GB-78) TaxID=517418 RepID=B3QUD4_CHLT3|nr:STAS domain-containing protein [Chloroherpeton thalassium]ACF14383.1 anti-sigma-factor antagonist [Chloroherpeton thalassium ATCC 35110]
MKFTVETKKELTVFKLHEKRLDASIAPELKSEFVVLIEAEDKKYLIIDLSQVDAIDSSGIGALLMAHRQTADHNGFAAYVGVKNKVRDLLKMTGLDKQLYIFSSLQEALNSIEAVDTEDQENEVETASAKKSRRSNDEDEDDFLSDIPNIDDIDEESFVGEALDESSFETEEEIDDRDNDRDDTEDDDDEEMDDYDIDEEPEEDKKQKKKPTKSTEKTKKKTQSPTKKARKKAE